MHSISKLVALSVLAVGTAIISAAAPSHAQAERQAANTNPAISIPGHPPCCTPAQQPVLTTGNGTWTVQPPLGSAMTAVTVTNPNVGWHAPLQGSQWIANVANAGQGSHPGGPVPYIYRTTFCLCGVPKGVPAFPAAMNLTIAADNSFVAKLNGNQFASGGPTAFITPIAYNVPTAYFQAGNNVLEIAVTNLPNSPTGLAVWGWIAGYFQPVAPGTHCP
jgi:hypothetical protein